MRDVAFPPFDGHVHLSQAYLDLPWRRRLVLFGLSDEAFHRITGANGERYFLKTSPAARNQ